VSSYCSKINVPYKIIQSVIIVYALIHHLRIVELRLQTVPEPEVLQSFLALALMSFARSSVTVVVHRSLMGCVVGGSHIREAGKAGVGMGAAVLVVRNGLFVLLRGFKVHLILDSRVPLGSLLDFGEFALHARHVLGLRERPHFGGLVDLGSRAEQILDAH
jgi:hypothetical protein